MEEKLAVLIQAKAMRYSMLALLVVLLAGLALYLKPFPEKEPLVGCGTKDSGSYLRTESEFRGKDLFTANCASCHNRNMRDDLTGPALGGVTDRWAAYPEKDLYSYIRNSQGMLKRKHPRAVELREQWKPAIMNPFPQLSDQDIRDILVFINAGYILY